ncbi:MAG TPA: PIN domain-containing protein [Bacteroidia bacterium]|nr:PIN domain-containing protein [Bacteroidia bacterium]
MLNITLDTCVWLKLLYIDFKNEDNYLEEICFWIENKHINHIVPTNIIDEWNRHKLSYQNNLVTYFKRKDQESINFIKHNAEFASTYNAEEVQKSVQKRIERIDAIFSTHSEKAPYDDLILKEAGLRNLQTIAPNHKGDSYRDTVNILSLIQYLKNKGYTKAIFTTDNYKDFCVDGGNRYELHDGLKTEFASASLTYEYLGENDDFGTRLFNLLRKELAANSFQVYLKDKKDKEAAAELAAKKVIVVKPIANPDADFLENIKHLDTIIAKKKRTSVDEEIIKIMIERHDSYKQYFLNNIGNNGLV